jgi:hypothetical protein
MDFELSNKCACVLTEVMKNLDNFTVFQDLFEPVREGVYLGEIEDITVAAHSDLDESEISLAADSLAVHPKD